MLFIYEYTTNAGLKTWLKAGAKDSQTAIYEKKKCRNKNCYFSFTTQKDVSECYDMIWKERAFFLTQPYIRRGLSLIV